MTAEAKSTSYLSNFPDSTESARCILPIVFSMVGTPRTIVDLGGGIGVWAKAAKDLGVGRVVCVDAPTIKPSELSVDGAEFIGWDLSVSMPPPIKSDLAISLEAAEHLPTGMTGAIVSFLTESAPVVLFSASIPGQPGHLHINEQPPGFWQKAFAAAGYQHWDVVRPNIIANTDLPYWYRQNISLFTAPGIARKLQLRPRPYAVLPHDFELVHESVLRTYRRSLETPGVSRWLRQFPAVLRKFVQRRIST